MFPSDLSPGLSILVSCTSSSDLEWIVEQAAGFGSSSDGAIEIVAAVPAGEISPGLVAGSMVPVRTLRTLDAPSVPGEVKRLNALVASASYDQVLTCNALDWFTPEAVAQVKSASSQTAAVVLASDADNDLVAALRDGASASIPTVLARSIALRAEVPTAAEVLPLESTSDTWVDFWIRLLVYAPLQLVGAPVGAAPRAFELVDASPEAPVSEVEALDRLRRHLAVACADGNLSRTASAEVAAATRLLLIDSATRANALLRLFPTLQMSAIDLLRRNRVWQFPYEHLNAGLARSLVVAYGYPPFTDTSGLVFARRTLERAQVVDVLSKDLTGRARRDPEALGIVEEFVAAQTLIGGEPSFDDWHAIDQYCQDGLAAIEAMSGGVVYSQIYSRAMWPPSHFLAALYKLRHPETTWIAEFSDPMRRDPSNGPRSAQILDDATSRELATLLAGETQPFPGTGDVYSWTEELPYRFADEILFTNAQQLQFMLSYSDPRLAESVRAKSTAEHHPTPPASFYQYSDINLELDPALVHIGYFGVFYPTRSLKSVADAIVSLPPADRDRLRLHVFCPRPIEMEQLAADAGLSSTIESHPYLAYFDFLHAITQFDCLLVDDFRTSETHPINPYLPSKWSDYVGSGTPIWRVTEPGSVLSQMRAAYQSDLDDVAGARRVLDEILEIGPRLSHTFGVKR